MAKRRSQLFSFPGAEVTIGQLPYELSEDLLPDVWQAVAAVVRSARDPDTIVRLAELAKTQDIGSVDVMELLPVIAGALSVIGEQLGDGKLKRIAPRLLSCTTVVMSDPDTGDKERLELSKLEDRAQLFEAYPHLYIPLVFLAGKVTYARFFSVRGLLASKEATPKAS